MDKSSLLTISDCISKMLTSNKSHIVVAIDGRGGSGKSTLANELKAFFCNVQIVEHDDFFYPRDLRTNESKINDFNFDWRRLEKEVLIPLQNNQKSIYQRYNWSEDANDGLVKGSSINPQGIIFIEGNFTMRSELRKYYGLTIWIECDKAICLQRGIARSIALKHHFWDNLSELNRQWHTFQQLEDIYILQCNPMHNANIVYNSVQKSIIKIK